MSIDLQGAPPDAQLDSVRELELRLARLEAEYSDLSAKRAAPQRTVAFSSSSILTVFGLAVAVAALVGLVYLAWGAITLMLIAILCALALNPAVEFFVRRGWRRGWAATAVFVLSFAAIAAILLLALPPLVDQITRFVDALPTLSHGRGPLGFLEHKFKIVEHAKKLVTGDSAVTVAVGVANMAISIVVVGFLTFFMLLEGPTWVSRLLGLMPEGARPRVHRVGSGVYRSVGGFMSGNLLAGLLGGALATVVLLATGVPYAIPLGLLVAVLDLLPIVGAILVIAVLGTVAATQGVVPAIVVVSFFFVYHQIEVYYLRPLIYGRTVELSPLAVLLTVVVGTALAGLLGAIAAIPVAGGIQAIFAEVGDARSHARRRGILDGTGSTPPRAAATDGTV